MNIENLFSLKNKRIIVTGASSGIGRETSILLSKLQANLIICGRNELRLLETLDSLDNKENHQLFLGDLNDEEATIRLLDSVEKIDGLVLISGIVKTLPIKFSNREELFSIMNTNFFSPVLLIQKAMKRKKVNKSGSIVFMSSIAGNNTASKGNGDYAASKAALNGICKVMAIEFAAQKIRVNAICPGMVKTPMTIDGFGTVVKEQLVLDEKTYPLGYGDPIDVAAGVVYLLSDASKWVTGTSFIIDGGRSIV
jgi:NAD(P)-dependent dehydrogenase (short-subunit alcohol dehydrogenase family)